MAGIGHKHKYFKSNEKIKFKHTISSNRWKPDDKESLIKMGEEIGIVKYCFKKYGKTIDYCVDVDFDNMEVTITFVCRNKNGMKIMKRLQNM